VPSSDVAHYEQFLSERPWLEESGFCWTVVEPVTAALGVIDVASRMGREVRPLEAGQQPIPYDEGGPGYGSIFVAAAVDGRVMLFEEEGLQGSRPEVLRWLSDGARACSLFWNVERDCSLSYAVYGQVVTALEPIDPSRRWGKDPAALDGELQVLLAATEADDDWRPVAMAVVERCGGVRLDQEWLGRAPTFAIDREHPPDPRPPGGIGYSDPDLDARLRLAPPELQASIVVDLLHDLAERYDLAEEPVIGRIFDRLPALLGDYDDALMREIVTLGAQLSADWDAERGDQITRSGPAWSRMQAANAFRAVLLPHGAWGSGLDAFASASYALGEDWPAVRAQIRARLTR
jgi:Family of unknown function (DUF6461)